MNGKLVLVRTLRKSYESLVGVDLVGSGLLDSLTIMDIIVDIEKEVGRSLSVGEIHSINFRSADDIVGFIEGLAVD